MAVRPSPLVMPVPDCCSVLLSALGELLSHRWGLQAVGSVSSRFLPPYLEIVTAGGAPSGPFIPGPRDAICPAPKDHKRREPATIGT